MSLSTLKEVSQDNFYRQIAIYATPRVMYFMLQNAQPVLDLRRAYEVGSVDEISIRAFVEELLKELVVGVRFSNQFALAAIAVALEPIRNCFTDEYLYDLARLRRNEMIDAIEVAGFCLQSRLKSSQSREKEFYVFTDQGQDQVEYEVAERKMSGKTGTVQTCNNEIEFNNA